MFNRNYYSVIALMLFTIAFILSGCTSELMSDNSYSLDIDYDNNSSKDVDTVCYKGDLNNCFISNTICNVYPVVTFHPNGGDGISYTDEEVVTFTEAADLYAQWNSVFPDSRVLLYIFDVESEYGHILLLNNSVKSCENVDLRWIDAKDFSSDYQRWNVSRRKIGSEGAFEVLSVNVSTNDGMFSFIYDSDYLYEIECKAGYNPSDINNGYGKIIVLSMQSVLNWLSSSELITDSPNNENDFLNEYIRQMIELELPRELAVT